MLPAILSCFLLAGIAPLVSRYAQPAAGWLLALLPFVLLWYFASFLTTISAGSAVSQSLDWLPQLDVALSFRLDGLSLVFALLITGIGAFIVIYAGAYLGGHPRRGGFLAVLLMFMGSMLGLVLADNIVAFFVFWELTSITSFLLIGFDHARFASRRAAIQALVVTGGGGLALLAGLIAMSLATGGWDLSALNLQGDALRAHPLYPMMLCLVLVGAFTKSAQVPFHFWLPNAMEAPTPVSAYLHSATMVKAGVYLLMRLTPALGGTELWSGALTVFGGATLLVGAVLSLRQTDLKLILAYTTVGSLGLLVMLLGLGVEKAVEAAVLYLIAHALFKGALFMVAGIVDHETGTRDITALAGLRHAMPLTFTAAIIAALSMSGLPPLVGFIAKEAIYGVTESGLVVTTAIAGNALMVAAALAVVWLPFTGAMAPTPERPHEPSLGLLLGPMVLALLGLCAGALVTAFGNLFAAGMVGAILGRHVSLDLALWHGFSTPLLMSIGTLALGVGAFALLSRLRAAIGSVLATLGWTMDRVYDAALSGLVRSCRFALRIIQPGLLRVYMLMILLMVTAALVLPALALGLPIKMPLIEVEQAFQNLNGIAIMLLALAGACAVVFVRSRLNAIVALGVQGVAVALLFLIYGAPDLAFTQFMVEILSVAILTLVMTRLRLDVGDRREISDRLVHGGIALVAAAGLGSTLVALTQQPLDLRLSAFFATHSVPEAHGRNIVNVILVDFRGLDTLGEITVVLMAGLAALALIRMRNRAAALGEDQDSERTRSCVQ
ncbi:putative monovalent cation/H+ antiporter subunit A [Rhodoligotrophos defluvii]|uniref:putative monovalent cation/H+ antiporter subunit A n=1 Tax=Rhodoligotrophos defluvii TaxID=2561934 RepID=UPI0010C93713|nr:putative monovalent cation/H+ antiporter subunit A [Rhodoligotrophos defluvii]